MYSRVFFKLSMIIGFLLVANLGFSQGSQTAMDVFDRVAMKYNGMNDYEVNVHYQVSGSIMTGVLYYKKPNWVRINFSRPANQVVVSNGRELTCYLPQTGVVFTQKLEKNGKSIGQGLVSEEGLAFMRQNYKISYHHSPEFVQVEGLSESVLGLRLVWRYTKAGFREIILYINQNFDILRFEGLDAAQRKLVCDFSNYQYNVGIPETRFDYTSPPTAHKQHNFLFDPEGN